MDANAVTKTTSKPNGESMSAAFSQCPFCDRLFEIGARERRPMKRHVRIAHTDASDEGANEGNDGSGWSGREREADEDPRERERERATTDRNPSTTRDSSRECPMGDREDTRRRESVRTELTGSATGAPT